MTRQAKRRTKSRSTGRKTSKAGEPAGSTAGPVEARRVPDSEHERIAEKDWLKTLIQWMIEGQNAFNIHEAMTLCMTAEPAEQARLWGEAWNHLTTAANGPPDQLRGWCIEASKDVYRKLLEVGDYAGALKAVIDLYKTFYRPRTLGGSSAKKNRTKG